MVSSRSNLDNNRDDTSFTDEIQTENLMKKPRGSCGVFPCNFNARERTTPVVSPSASRLPCSGQLRPIYVFVSKCMQTFV